MVLLPVLQPVLRPGPVVWVGQSCGQVVVKPVVWMGQSCDQVVTPVLYSFSGKCGHVAVVGPTSEKGVRVYGPNRPAPTITSHMNTLFLVCDTGGDDEHDVIYLGIESVMLMKSFCEDEASFIRGLPLARACKVVANAILRSLLNTVYERILAIRPTSTAMATGLWQDILMMSLRIRNTSARWQ